MSNKWFYLNYTNFSETTLTASSANADYPVSNIQHYHTVKEYRSATGTLSVTIVFDLGVARTVDSFLIVGNKATGTLSATSFNLEANATDTWGSPAYSLGSQTLTQNELDEAFAYRAVTSNTYRYWRLTLVNSSGYVGCSNVYLGQETVLSANAISFGWEFQRLDRSTIQEGRYGQRFADRINDQKRIRGSIELVNTTEFDQLDDMFNYCGVTIPLWMIVDSTESIVSNKNIYAGYFYLTERPTFVNVAYSLMNTTFDLIEVI